LLHSIFLLISRHFFVMPTENVTVVIVPAAAYLRGTAYILWEIPWEEM